MLQWKEPAEIRKGPEHVRQSFLLSPGSETTRMAPTSGSMCGALPAGTLPGLGVQSSRWRSVTKAWLTTHVAERGLQPIQRPSRYCVAQRSCCECSLSGRAQGPPPSPGNKDPLIRQDILRALAVTLQEPVKGKPSVCRVWTTQTCCLPLSGTGPLAPVVRSHLHCGLGCSRAVHALDLKSVPGLR